MSLQAPASPAPALPATSAECPRRRRRGIGDALLGLLAVQPFRLDPRWIADETGQVVPNWELLAEHAI